MGAQKIRVLLLAGGQSDEHEVSVTSARSVLQACQGTPLEITPLVITREGRWLTSGESQKALSDGSAKSGGELTLHRAQITEQFDVVFPLIHGPNGEDGTIQGMLELAGIPYVGAGVLASSLCMDKAMFKDVFRAHGVPQVRYELVTSHMWRTEKQQVLRRCAELKFPSFAKPANLGSSVGISKVKSADQLEKAIELALQYDRRVIVEAGVPNPRELEVAILGNDEPRASPVGEITYASEFYDYETKYTEGKAQLHIPADVPKDVSDRIRDIGIRAFRLADCAGFARVDFFYTSNGDILLNEINTIPGFTPFSMFSKLWEAGGVGYAQLVQTLVELAIERHRPRAR